MKITYGMSYREAAGQKAIPAKVAAFVRVAAKIPSRQAIPDFDTFLKLAGGLVNLIGEFDEHYNEWPELQSVSEEQQKKKVLEIAYQDLHRRYRNALDTYWDWEFPLDVYREVCLPDISALKTDHVGINWSYEAAAAEAHWCKGGEKYLLRGRVQENAVDWFMTIYHNIWPSLGEEEKEVTLKPGARIELLGIRESGPSAYVQGTPMPQWQAPPKKIVTAARLSDKQPEQAPEKHKIRESLKPTDPNDYHMVEGCGIWAVDFARGNGGQIYILSADYGEEWSDEIPYEVTHAFVRKGGKDYDVRGRRTPGQMAEELNMGSFSIKGPWTPDAFEEKFMGDSDEKPLYGKTAAKPPAFYHGTKAANLDDILKNGLKVGKSEAHTEWNKAIYLACDAYTAKNYEGMHGGGEPWVVLQIDGSKLDEYYMRPDDYDFPDLWVQAGKTENWAVQDWETSLKVSCQIAYLADIPPDAIKVIEAPKFAAKNPYKGGRYYHGTNVEFEPGDILEPGHWRNFSESADDAISITSDKGRAEYWADQAGGTFVYEVEPLGTVTEHKVGPADYGKSKILWEGRVPRARVLREVEFGKPVRAAESMAAAVKLYHGSRKKFKPGTILEPQADGYVNSAEPDVRKTESILESARPAGALSRKECVFMVADPDEIDYAGGYEDYIYEVQPIGRVEKNDMDWYSALDVYQDSLTKDQAGKLAKGYWSGKAKGRGKHTLFEYRSPKAKVVRLISNPMGERFTGLLDKLTVSAKTPSIGYHWTDEDGIEGILQSGRWDAGSVTANPAYRYQKGEPGSSSSSRFALLFDLDKGGFEPREDKTVPWDEWEWLGTKDIDIWDFPGGAFLGFGVRDQKSAARLRAMMKREFDDASMFPIKIISAAKTAAGNLTFKVTNAVPKDYAGQVPDKSFMMFENKKEVGAIGYLILHNKTFQIVDAYVLPERRGEGLGKKMYIALFNYAKKRGYNVISDEALSPPAEGVWESLLRDGLAEVEGEQYAAKFAALKNYVGNCTEDDVIARYWGDATLFAQALEAAEPVSENVVFDPVSGLVVKYDPETDIHSFFTK